MAGFFSQGDGEFSDAEIIAELKNTADGEALSHHGAGAAICRSMERPGETYVFIDDDDSITVCHVDHEHCLDEMDFGRYGWSVSGDDQLLELTLIIRDREYDGRTHLSFSFKKKDREARRQIMSIIARGSVTVHFLSIQYGQLHKYATGEFAIPDAIIASLKG